MTVDNLTVSSEWHLRFEHTLGPAASTFLTRLRDDGVLLASHCRVCNRNLVPPRDFCERCFVPLDPPTTELAGVGVLQGYTVVFAELPGYRKPPYALAYVKLDGADTSLGNYLERIDYDDPATITVGARVRAVMAEEREGRITDFHWELASHADGE